MRDDGEMGKKRSIQTRRWNREKVTNETRNSKENNKFYKEGKESTIGTRQSEMRRRRNETTKQGEERRKETRRTEQARPRRIERGSEREWSAGDG